MWYLTPLLIERASSQEDLLAQEDYQFSQASGQAVIQALKLNCIIGFLNQENMDLDTKIIFLNALFQRLWSKTYLCNVFMCIS